MAFRGTVDRIDGERAYVTYTEEDESTHLSSLPTWILSKRGIGEGDDFMGIDYETPDGARALRFILLPRRELTPVEVDAIRQQAEELRDG